MAILNKCHLSTLVHMIRKRIDLLCAAETVHKPFMTEIAKKDHNSCLCDNSRKFFSNETGNCNANYCLETL